MADAGAKRPRRVDLRWTERRRRRFITALATSYDTEVACEAAGLDWATVCRLRVMHPEFAAEIEEVITAGYDRLEAQLLRKAGAVIADAGDKADLALAAALLKQRRAVKGSEPARAGRAGGGKPVGGKPGERKPLTEAQREKLFQSILNNAASARRGAERGDVSDGETADRHVQRRGAEGGG